MTKPNSYVPRLNDSVLLEDSDNRLVVVDVDASRETAALRTIAGLDILYENVPWSKLSYRDQCETLAREDARTNHSCSNSGQP